MSTYYNASGSVFAHAVDGYTTLSAVSGDIAHGLSKGAVGGVVAGIIVALGLLGGVLFLLLGKRHRAGKSAKRQSQGTSYAPLQNPVTPQDERFEAVKLLPEGERSELPAIEMGNSLLFRSTQNILREGEKNERFELGDKR